MTDKPPPQLEHDEGEFGLRPLDCPSREELERELEGPLEFPAPAPPTSTVQFSLRDIMVLMVGVSAGLAGGSWMPTDVFAGALGLATLLGLLLVSWHPPESHWGQLAWTAFVLAYFTAVIAAIVRPAAH